MLQTEPFVPKIGFDTAENGPSKAWAINPRPDPRINICAHGRGDVSARVSAADREFNCGERLVKVVAPQEQQYLMPIRSDPIRKPCIMTRSENRAH